MSSSSNTLSKIPLIQRISKFTCRTPKEAFMLAQVSPSFSETMRVYQTTTSIILDLLIAKQETENDAVDQLMDFITGNLLFYEATNNPPHTKEILAEQFFSVIEQIICGGSNDGEQEDATRKKRKTVLKRVFTEPDQHKETVFLVAIRFSASPKIVQSCLNIAVKLDAVKESIFFKSRVLSHLAEYESNQESFILIYNFIIQHTADNEEELKQLLTKKSIDNETCLFMFAPQIHFLPPGFIEDSLLPKLEEVGVLKEILETRESRSDEGQIALHEYISPSVGPGWSHGQPLTPTPLPTLQKLLDAYKKCGLLDWALLDAKHSAVARWSVYHLSRNPLDVVKFVIANYFESGEQYRDMVMAIKDDDYIGGFSFTNESDSDDKAEHCDFFMKKNPIDAWKESVEKYSK